MLLLRAAIGRTSSVLRCHSAVLPGVQKGCGGMGGSAQMSSKRRSGDEDPWVEDIGGFGGDG